MKETSRRLDKFLAQIFKSLKFLSQHLALITGAITFAFSAGCLLYCVNFLKAFGLDFFHYGSLTDIFQIPFANGYIKALFTILILVPSFIASVKMYLVYAHNNKDPANKFFLIGLIFSAACLVLMFFFAFGLFPESKSSEIKRGVTARFNIKTSYSEFVCLSQIGRTKDFFFLWDIDDQKAIIIPSSEVRQIELTIESMPKHEGNTPKPRNFDEQISDWKEKLKTLCDQEIT